MLSIVYSSTAVRPFSEDELSALLAGSREYNSRHGLTGILMYRNGRFLQLLEGEEDAVRERMTAIVADPRHANAMTLIEEQISTRQFPEWTMAYEKVTAETEDDIPGYRRSFEILNDGDLLDEEHATDTMRALKRLMVWFQTRYAARF